MCFVCFFGVFTSDIMSCMCFMCFVCFFFREKWQSNVATSRQSLRHLFNVILWKGNKKGPNDYPPQERNFLKWLNYIDIHWQDVKQFSKKIFIGETIIGGMEILLNSKKRNDGLISTIWFGWIRKEVKIPRVAIRNSCTIT